MTWEVDGEAITDAAGIASPSAEEEAWADACAAAVNAAYATRLNGYSVEAASSAEDELGRAALLDGLAAYRDKDAPYGILSIGADGEAIRVGADIIRAGHPALMRYALPGIG